MAATDLIRPHTAMGYNKQFKRSCNQVQLADHLLLPGFQKHLQDFYMKASPEDRLRCADLITDLDQSDPRIRLPYNERPQSELKYKRPQTAMACLEQYRDPLDPYSTTYKREYKTLQFQPTKPIKPKNTFRQTELAVPRRTTTYATEYCYKGQPLKQDPESPDPHKRNNPHPAEGFIMWRLPGSKKLELGNQNWELTDQMLDEVMHGQLTSTYQNDFVGLPPGKEGVKSVKLAFGNMRDTRSDVPYTLNTSTRRTYQTPEVQPQLATNTLRYGCNKQKNVAVTGVVPTVSSRYLKIQPRTTYESEFSYCNSKTIAAKEQRKKKEREIRDRNRAMFQPPQTASSSHSSSLYHVYPTRCLETPTTPLSNY
ncbi:hypothetical protein LSH36_15g16011 [Paralvinella palmiformis]|uniref:Uncharacterized protein n=1 Tax=Paralvinella palmiformis TaxID=53620 RepID=A0AAD9KBL5_9ANNE|nr:hypothetical protein LSH36_15g16011 [Paralvinella palmiformis]